MGIAKQIGDKRSQGIWLNNIGYFFSSFNNKNSESLACYLLAKQINEELGNPRKIAQTESDLKDFELKLGEIEFNRLLTEVTPKAEEIVQKLLQEN